MRKQRYVIIIISLSLSLTHTQTHTHRHTLYIQDYIKTFGSFINCLSMDVQRKLHLKITIMCKFTAITNQKRKRRLKLMRTNTFFFSIAFNLFFGFLQTAEATKQPCLDFYHLLFLLLPAPYWEIITNGQNQPKKKKGGGFLLSNS